MFSIIFPENSRIWVNLLPPDDLMSSSSTWKHSGPSHLPKNKHFFSEDATNSPENLTNNEHVPSVCIQQLIFWANKRWQFAASSHSTNHQRPGLSNLFSKLLRLQHTLIWDGMVSVPYLIHETSTDVLFIWHRDPRNGTSRVAMWAALDKTSCSFRNSCKSCWKEKKRHQANVPPKKF